MLFAIPSHAFEYEDLVALIRDKELTTIDTVIENLPKEYLQNFTLAFGSRSLHGSSYENPRVILFGNTAKFIIAFNGDPTHSEYHSLEAMQFREESKVFELRSISFENGVRFSGKNPSVCQNCHGINPRPIWSSYEYSDIEDREHWPGFYGSTHDAPVLNEREREAYIRFRKLAAEHRRYRFLILDHPETDWYPFGTGPHQHRFRPNNRLGNLLARLNAKRIANDLKSKVFFQKYPNIALQWLLQCNQAEQEHYLSFIKSLYDRDVEPLLHVKLDQFRSKSVEQVAFVFEKLLSGLDVYTWNLSLNPSPDEPRFFTGIVSIDDLVAAAVLSELADNHWLRRYYVPWTQRQLYNSFQEGYYDANVAPGEVGKSYDEIELFFDRERAKQACSQLEQYGREEAGMKND
ncbi:MAG: hypothetical protein QNI91_04630 [Arenicellales bacterium]|nr:hypothetical protein [Arenicellales bacterium]